MAGRGRADDQLLLALAAGAYVEHAAEHAGVSERTVYRRLADPAFRADMRAIRREMFEQATARLVAASASAATTLAELAEEGQREATRVAVARAVLELALKLRTADELEARVAALEAQTGPIERPNGLRRAG
jgi:hypothetical protein